MTAVPSTSAVTVLAGNCVITHGIPTDLLTDNGLQLQSNFFAALTEYLGMKHLTTTAYHPGPTDKRKGSTEQLLSVCNTTQQRIRPTGTSMCNCLDMHTTNRYPDRRARRHSTGCCLVSYLALSLQTQPVE